MPEPEMFPKVVMMPDSPNVRCFIAPPWEDAHSVVAGAAPHGLRTPLGGLVPRIDLPETNRLSR